MPYFLPITVYLNAEVAIKNSGYPLQSRTIRDGRLPSLVLLENDMIFARQMA